MKGPRPFLVIGIAFLAIGVSRMVDQTGMSGAAFLALGATFLAISARKARQGRGDAR